MHLIIHIWQRKGLYLWRVVDEELPRWHEPLMSGSSDTYAMAAECAKVAHDIIINEQKDV